MNDSLSSSDIEEEMCCESVTEEKEASNKKLEDSIN